MKEIRQEMWRGGVMLLNPMYPAGEMQFTLNKDADMAASH